jgi:hypothetical protein
MEKESGLYKHVVTQLIARAAKEASCDSDRPDERSNGSVMIATRNRMATKGERSVDLRLKRTWRSFPSACVRFTRTTLDCSSHSKRIRR